MKIQSLGRIDYAKYCKYFLLINFSEKNLQRDEFKHFINVEVILIEFSLYCFKESFQNICLESREKNDLNCQ